jgi:hypothetical protein
MLPSLGKARPRCLASKVSQWKQYPRCNACSEAGQQPLGISRKQTKAAAKRSVVQAKRRAQAQPHVLASDSDETDDATAETECEAGSDTESDGDVPSTSAPRRE